MQNLVSFFIVNKNRSVVFLLKDGELAFYNYGENSEIKLFIHSKGRRFHDLTSKYLKGFMRDMGVEFPIGVKNNQTSKK